MGLSTGLNGLQCRTRSGAAFHTRSAGGSAEKGLDLNLEKKV